MVGRCQREDGGEVKVEEGKKVKRGRGGGEKLDKWNIMRVEKRKRWKGEGGLVEDDEGKWVEKWESDFF
jgi:hypothetical protein